MAPSPKKHDRDLIGRPQLHGQAHPGDDARPSGNDRDGGEHPDRGVPEVHRPTFALARPGPLAVELRHGLARRHAFSQGMPMGPVRRSDPVVAAQDVAHAYSHSLLALVLVKRPGDLAFQEQAEDALLEASNEQHPSVQRRCRRSTGLDHLLTHRANDRGCAACGVKRPPRPGGPVPMLATSTSTTPVRSAPSTERALPSSLLTAMTRGDGPQVIGTQPDDPVADAASGRPAFQVEEVTEDVAHRARLPHRGHLGRGEATHLHHSAVVAGVADADEGGLRQPGTGQRLADVAVAHERFPAGSTFRICGRVQALGLAPEPLCQPPADVVGVDARAHLRRASHGGDEGAGAAGEPGELIGDGTDVAPHADGDHVAVAQRPGEQVPGGARSHGPLRVLAVLVGHQHRPSEPEAGRQVGLELGAQRRMGPDRDVDDPIVPRLLQQPAHLGARQAEPRGDLGLGDVLHVVQARHPGHQLHFRFAHRGHPAEV